MQIGIIPDKNIPIEFSVGIFALVSANKPPAMLVEPKSFSFK